MGRRGLSKREENIGDLKMKKYNFKNMKWLKRKKKMFASFLVTSNE